MQLDILTPEKKLYSGDATSIKLPGISGNFELLDNHAPIISALAEGEIKYSTSEGETKIVIKDGFVECLQNKVVVLIGS
ncbi:MAG: F0F1 ATP synthase subunit epsilon, partial [Chitinophagales bacterium]